MKVVRALAKAGYNVHVGFLNARMVSLQNRLRLFIVGILSACDSGTFSFDDVPAMCKWTDCSLENDQSLTDADFTIPDTSNKGRVFVRNREFAQSHILPGQSGYSVVDMHASPKRKVSRLGYSPTLCASKCKGGAIGLVNRTARCDVMKWQDCKVGSLPCNLGHSRHCEAVPYVMLWATAFIVMY